MTLQEKDKAYATFNIQQFSHPVFLEDGITDMRLVDKRLILFSSKSLHRLKVTGSRKVFLLRNIAIDKDIMQVQVPKQYEALTVAANEDMAIISSSKSHLMSTIGSGDVLALQRESEVLKKAPLSITRNAFREMAASESSFFVAIDTDHEVHMLSRL